MKVVVDTSALIAVIANEPHKARIIELTAGAELIAPASVPWEVGNAFSAMFKRRRVALVQALAALKTYRKIPIRFVDADIERSLNLCSTLGIYAYDAYILDCALQHDCPLLSLDNGLLRAAAQAGARTLTVIQ